MYYKLADSVRLRSYDRLPRLVLRHDRPVAVSSAEFQALDLCDGTIDLDFPLVPEDVRKTLPGLVERGLVEACEKGSELVPGQVLRRYPNRYIRSVHWSITGACNFRCRHCFMEAPHAKHPDLSTEELFDICDQLAEAGVSSVALTGGEPLIRKDFLELARRIVEDGMELGQIYTNGALVTGPLLDALLELGARPQFCISFDGVGRHDWLRNVDGAEAAAVRAFELCRERGLPVHASMAVHAGNVDVLLETAEALASWGVGSFKIGALSEMGEWERGGFGEPLPREELLRAYLDFVPRYVEAGLPLKDVQVESIFRIVRPNEEWRPVDEAPPELSGSPAEREASGPVLATMRKRCTDPGHACLCLSTRLNPYISSEGRVLPCMMMGDATGPVAESFPLLSDASLVEILTDSTLMEATDSRLSDLLAANAECAACEHAMDCLGGCRMNALLAHPDTYFGIDDGTCRLFRDGWVERFEALANEVNAAYARSQAGAFRSS